MTAAGWWGPGPIPDPQRSPEARARRVEETAQRAAVVAEAAFAAKAAEIRRMLPYTIGATLQRLADERGLELTFGPGR